MNTAEAGMSEKVKVMTKGSFPSDFTKRKAILVLEQHDIEKCEYTPGAAQQLLDEEAYILQFPVRAQGEAPSALQNILEAHLARPGSMLVQSPYNTDVYVEASLAPQRFALEKHMLFLTFCRHLGAKEVNVEQIDLRTTTGNSSLDVKGARLGVSAQLTAENDELESFRAQMLLHNQFAGGPPDVAAAEQLLHRAGLRFDPIMQGLLEMRRDGANQLFEHKLVLKLSSEARNNLQVVGRLNVPQFVKLSADYKRLVHQQHDFTLTILVRF